MTDRITGALAQERDRMALRLPRMIETFGKAWAPHDRAECARFHADLHALTTAMHEEAMRHMQEALANAVRNGMSMAQMTPDPFVVSTKAWAAAMQEPDAEGAA